MTALVDLNRASYMTLGGTTRYPVPNYLSAKFKNIKFLLPAADSYMLSQSDAANLPGLAKKLLGDVGYWWVLALYNGILDPVSDLVPGRVLQIPSVTDINALLSTTDTRNANINLII